MEAAADEAAIPDAVDAAAVAAADMVVVAADAAAEAVAVAVAAAVAAAVGDTNNSPGHLLLIRYIVTRRGLRIHRRQGGEYVIVVGSS